MSDGGLVIAALGGLQVRLGDRSIDRDLPLKALALITYLADVDRPVPRSELAGLLWSDLTEDRARANLRLVLTKLRRLRPDLVQTDRHTVRLGVVPDYDVAAIESSTAEIAIAGYTGDFLDGIEFGGAAIFDDWVQARRYSIRSTALAHIGSALGQARAEDDWSAMQQLAARVLEIEPWNEVAHRDLMRALEWTSGRAAALTQFERCSQVLRSELGLDPEPETRALAESIRSSGAATTPREADIVGLPRSLTPFFGREAELALLEERLLSGGYRLVTVLGPGGVGKTRLAESIVRRVRSDFEHIVFASLAGVNSRAEIATVLNGLLAPDVAGRTADPTDQLVAVLGDATNLLVLDNVEHIVDGAAELVSTVLARCGGTKVVATSRQPLRLTAEDLFELRGLPVPDDATGAETVDETVDETDAVRLFVDRAYRTDKSFSLSAANAADVAALCRLVDGVPLYLELAATHVSSLSIGGIVDALSDAAQLPDRALRDVPSRHAAFQAVFAESWKLLDPAEQVALTRLSVTRGGFDRNAAAALIDNPVLASAIARKSLLVEEGRGRFRFHELVRQSAEGRLAGDDQRSTEIAHARHFLQLLAEAEPQLGTASTLTVAAPLLPDLDNVRAAWARAIRYGLIEELATAAPGTAKLLEVAGSSFEAAQLLQDVIDALVDGRLVAVDTYDEAHFRQLRAGQLCRLVGDESVDRECELVLSMLGDAPERARDRGWTLLHRARSGLFRLDTDRCDGYVEQALAEAHEIGDETLVAWCLSQQGRLHAAANRYEDAVGAMLESLSMFEDLGDLRAQAHVYNYLSTAYVEQYRLWESYQADCRAVEVAEAIGNRQDLALVYANVGASVLLLGGFDIARRRTEQALDLARRSGDLLLEGYFLTQLGEALMGQGDTDGAERALGEGLAMSRERGDAYGVLYGLAPWSRLMLDKGRLTEAGLAAEELVEVATDRGVEDVALAGRALAARIDAAAGHATEAERVAIACWEAIHHEPAPNLLWPIETRLDIVAVLGHRHDVGSAALREAYEIQHHTASAIRDPRLRRAFLEQRPEGRALARFARPPAAAPGPVVRVLGPVQVVRAGRATDLPSTSQRRCLAALAIHAPRRVQADWLGEVLGVTPGALRQLVARVRRVVGDGVVHTSTNGYRLDAQVDAVLAEAEFGDAGGDPEALADVFERWAGPSLAEFAAEPWAAGSASRLDELRANVAEARATALIDHGRFGEAIGVLEAHIAEHPFRDQPQGLLIRALAATGRRAEALRAYQTYRSFLADQTGLEPSNELREIEQRVASGWDGRAPSPAEVAG